MNPGSVVPCKTNGLILELQMYNFSSTSCLLFLLSSCTWGAELPEAEFCSWLFADCPWYDNNVMPSDGPASPVDVSVMFRARRLLYIDELSQQ